MMTPLGTLIIVVLIGIIVGLVFNRYGRTWLGRQVTDATGVGDITYSLIGIAGSFLGYHLGTIGGLGSPALSYLAAIIGAALTIWLWRGR
jgi:uncharacterized membrane protein YeaQ/YmgE (transglycosylase-associated protein family)